MYIIDLSISYSLNCSPVKTVEMVASIIEGRPKSNTAQTVQNLATSRLSLQSTIQPCGHWF